LEVLHPVLQGHIVALIKKQQRKIDTLELKQQITKPVEECTDERVKTLERVNREMKK
jgi:hypothetical protein